MSERALACPKENTDNMTMFGGKSSLCSSSSSSELDGEGEEESDDVGKATTVADADTMNPVDTT